MNSDLFRTQRDVGSAVVAELSAAGFADADEIGRGVSASSFAAIRWNSLDWCRRLVCDADADWFRQPRDALPGHGRKPRTSRQAWLNWCACGFVPHWPSLRTNPQRHATPHRMRSLWSTQCWVRCWASEVGDSGGMRSAANMNITKSATSNPIPHQVRMRLASIARKTFSRCGRMRRLRPPAPSDVVDSKQPR
jgi:hypothetical protein